MSFKEYNEEDFFTEFSQKLDSVSTEFRETDWLKLKSKLKTEENFVSNDFDKNKRPLFKTILYAAAMITVILVLSIFIKLQYFSTDNLVYTTTNNIENIILPDGSEVWLNKNSRFTFIENKNIREAELVGEAYFNVKHNANRKFVIRTPKSIISVLGTSFNVYAYKEIDTEITTVESGIVEVKNIASDVDNPIMLKKGQACEIQQEKAVFKEENKDLNFLSWKTNKFEFLNTPLSEVVQILSKHYNKKIVIDNNKLDTIGFNSSFQDEELINILEIIKLTLGIDFEMQNDIVVLKENNNGQGFSESN